MKKLYLLIIGSSLLFSCTTDSVDSSDSENITAQFIAETTTLGTYKGVFTTLDSEYRATFDIRIPKASDNSSAVEKEGFPEATINLHSGEVHKIYANQKVYDLEQLPELEFTSSNLSFTFKLSGDDDTPEINGLQYNGLEAAAMVAAHTVLAPVTTITGTYSCLDCNGSPYLDTGMSQTFNMMFTVADGQGAITTQTLLGPTETIGIGYQYFCNPNGETTNCLIGSGDGSTTTVGYLSNGNPVYWLGIHYFNTQSNGSGNDCDGMYGLWRWESNSYGILTGLFESDTNCDEAPDLDVLNSFDLSQWSASYPFQVN